MTILSDETIKKLKHDELKEYLKESIYQLRERIIIPCHHYQHPDVIAFADFIGDSYKLSVESSKSDREFIIYCGVFFMAESASILMQENQKTVIPDPRAGCPMADMADINLVKKAYQYLQERCSFEIVPVVYMNSYADLKSFCGEENGAVCTSSNAEKIITYYLNRDKTVLFFPDYYLGINSTNKLGIPHKELEKIPKNLKFNNEEKLKKCRIFLWDGYCPTHQRFTVADIQQLRKDHIDIKIIVHPECQEEVVKLADFSGSTEKIYHTIKDAAPASKWGIGTETTFVERLAAENPDKLILPLRKSQCKNMLKTNLTNLSLSINSIKNFIEYRKELKFAVEVSNEFKINARKALNKMIEIASM